MYISIRLLKLGRNCPQFIKSRQTYITMGKKKKLMDVKRDLQIIKKNNLGKLIGGRKTKRGNRWNTCGGLVPQ